MHAVIQAVSERACVCVCVCVCVKGESVQYTYLGIANYLPLRLFSLIFVFTAESIALESLKVSRLSHLPPPHTHTHTQLITLMAASTLQLFVTLPSLVVKSSFCWIHGAGEGHVGPPPLRIARIASYCEPAFDTVLSPRTHLSTFVMRCDSAVQSEGGK